MKFINKSKGSIGIGRRKYAPGEFNIKEPFSDSVKAALTHFEKKGTVQIGEPIEIPIVPEPVSEVVEPVAETTPELTPSKPKTRTRRTKG